MYENTIEYILSNDTECKKSFKGALSKDEFPKKISYPSCFVINTKPRTHYGEHWLALYFDENKSCHFFDSYGLPPTNYGLETKINQTSLNCYYNDKRLQGNSNYCGLYCILYLLFVCRNKKNEFYSSFFNDYFLNDKLLFSYIKTF